jgi:hypothetical protein
MRFTAIVGLVDPLGAEGNGQEAAIGGKAMDELAGFSTESNETLSFMA